MQTATMKIKVKTTISSSSIFLIHKAVKSGVLLVMGRTMFEVRLLGAKNRVFQFDYQKINMFESVQCWEKTMLDVRCTFVRSKPKIGGSSSITKGCTHSSSFDVGKMIRCSTKRCSTHH